MKHTLSVVSASILILFALSCTKAPKLDKVITANGLKVTVAVVKIDPEKKIHGVVGKDVKNPQGYYIALKYGNRKSIVLSSDAAMKEEPSDKVLKDIIDRTHILLSPDNEHLAFWIDGKSKFITFYHIMKKGVPFNAGRFDNKYSIAKKGADIVWQEMGSPHNRAKYFIISRAKSDDDYSLGNPYLWESIGELTADSGYGDIILNFWPNLRETRLIVQKYAKKGSGISEAWLGRLKGKISNLKASNPSPSTIAAIKGVCAAAKDSKMFTGACKDVK